MSAVDFGHAKSLGHFGAFNNSVAVHSHGSDMNEVAFWVELHHGQKHVESGLRVVGVGFADCGQVLHRVGSRLEFGQVDDHVGVELLEQDEELVPLSGYVDLLEADLLASKLFPLLDSLLDRFDRTDAGVAVLLVDFSSVEVVHNHDLVAEVGESQTQRPSDKSIAASN